MPKHPKGFEDFEGEYADNPELLEKVRQLKMEAEYRAMKFMKQQEYEDALQEQERKKLAISHGHTGISASYSMSSTGAFSGAAMTIGGGGAGGVAGPYYSSHGSAGQAAPKAEYKEVDYIRLD